MVTIFTDLFDWPPELSLMTSIEAPTGMEYSPAIPSAGDLSPDLTRYFSEKDMSRHDANLQEEHFWTVPPLRHPPMSTDTIIYYIVEQERQKRRDDQAHHILRPTVFGFLVEAENNPVSKAVKQDIGQMGGNMRMPEALACYWIVYTVLRVCQPLLWCLSVFMTDCAFQWFIHRDFESFNALPEWLKPTRLQMVQLHPICLSFTPW